MAYGDIRLNGVVDFKFTTSVNRVPTSLAGAPVVSAYPGNSTTQITAGITLTVDFDGVVGLNHVHVVASAANGYLTATDYDLELAGGTLGGVSIVEVIESFSIENRSALMPATSGRTLVVDAAGLADATAVKVGPTGAGTAQTAGDIVGDTNDLQTRLPAALVGGRIDSSVGAVASGVIAAASFAAGAFDAVWTVTARTLSAAGVQAMWDALTSALTTVGSIGKLFVDNVNATIASRATPAQVNTEADTALSDVGVTSARQTKLDSLTFTGANRIDANVAAVNNSTVGVDKLSAHLQAVLKVIVGSGSTTTSVVLNGTTGIDGAVPSTTNDFYNGRVLVLTSGALAGQATSVEDYDGATKTLTVVALTGSPASAVTGVIV